MPVVIVVMGLVVVVVMMVGAVVARPGLVLVGRADGIGHASEAC